MESEFYDPELELLDPSLLDDSTSSMPDHTLRMAPVLTGDALHLLGTGFIPQRALYGCVISQRGDGFQARPTNPKIYINTNTPFSALVCGVQVHPEFPTMPFPILKVLQGSGKSHSTSVLLESCLMSDPRLGTLPAPLSALV